MDRALSVLLIKDHGVWAAQCLEHNIAAQGATTQEALLELSRTVAAEIALRAEKGMEGLAGIPRAPDLYWRMFGASDRLRTKDRPLFHPDRDAPPAFMLPEFRECRVA